MNHWIVAPRKARLDVEVSPGLSTMLASWRSLWPLALLTRNRYDDDGLSILANNYSILCLSRYSKAA